MIMGILSGQSPSWAEGSARCVWSEASAYGKQHRTVSHVPGTELGLRRISINAESMNDVKTQAQVLALPLASVVPRQLFLAFLETSPCKRKKIISTF